MVWFVWYKVEYKPKAMKQLRNLLEQTVAIFGMLCSSTFQRVEAV